MSGLYTVPLKIRVLPQSWQLDQGWKSFKGFWLCARVWFSFCKTFSFSEGLGPLLGCGKLNPLLSTDRHGRGYSSANLPSFQTLSLDTFYLGQEGKEDDAETDVSWVLGSKYSGPAFVPVIFESGAAVWAIQGLSPARNIHSFLWHQDSKSCLYLLIICTKEKQ